MHYSTHLLRHTRCLIGKNIHHQRIRQKITLEKLARLSGVSEWLIDRYELGKNEIRLDELLRIACVFDVGVEELLV